MRSILTRFNRFLPKLSPFFPYLIFCGYFVLVFFNLTNGHEWGDDFAHYLLQARSLLFGTTDQYIAGTNFTNSLSTFPHSPTTVPWGFPLLLLPFVKIFNQSMLGLKLVNVLVYSAFLFVVYRWTRLWLPKSLSALVLLFFAVNVVFIRFHNLIFSDLLFLLFSTLSLYLLELFIRNPDNKIQYGLLLGLSIFFASFTRISGYLLLPALFFTQIVMFIQNRKISRRVDSSEIIAYGIPYLVFSFLFLIQALLLPNFSQTISAVVEKMSPDILWRNIVYYFSLPSYLFTGTSDPVFFYLLSLPIFLIGIIDKRKSKLSWAMLFYFILTLGLYIAFPGRQGIRYIFPLIPIYILYITLGIFEIANKIHAKYRWIFNYAMAIVFAFAIVQFLIADIQSAIKNINNERTELSGPYSTQNQEIWDYIRKETPPDGVVIFMKPRAVRWLTGRNSYFSNTCHGIEQGDYLLWLKEEGFLQENRQMSKLLLDMCIDLNHLNKIKENDEVILYRIPGN